MREHLDIQKWQVFGGSWGSTLALAYAETHPDRVTELVLRGIFLCRPKEIKWFYQEGASWIFPDVWEEYVRIIPDNERDDFVSAYYRRLTGADGEGEAARDVLFKLPKLRHGMYRVKITLRAETNPARQTTFSRTFPG